MLGDGITLGRLFGIRLAVSLSWFLIFFLVWFSLSGVYLPAHYPRWPLPAVWAAGLVASLLFFVCVVLHELAHSLVALRNKIPVRSITLFMLGGVSRIGRDAPSPGVEFAIAVAGPLSSLGIAAVSGGLWLLVNGLSRPVGDLLLWLAYINFTLALFNLLPGFPLDGGRVLRSIVWFAADDFDWASQVATRAGQLSAATMMLAGAFLLIQQQRGGLANALWLVLIGWFLFSAAGNSYHSAMAMHALRGLLARDVMRREPLIAEADQPLSRLGEDFLARVTGDPAVVVRDGAILGLVYPRSLRRFSAERLAAAQVSEAMTTLTPGQLLADDLPAGEVLQSLVESGNEGLPVVADGRAVGLVRQADLFQVIELRRRLGR